MTQPVIGITGGYIKMSDFSEGDYAHKDYTASLIMAGAVPLILPVAPGPCVERYADLCDGFLFSGGCDVNPRFFGEDPLPGCDVFDTARDQAEFQLLHEAMKRGKSVFGICRGMQIINVAFGGTLIQDIGSALEHPIQHDQKIPRSEGSHRVQVERDTQLHHVLGGQETIIVNSLHHQSIARMGNGLRVAARSADGIIEAVDITESGLLGVQWHPESMAAAGNEQMLDLFRFFVTSCGHIKRTGSILCEKDTDV